jgi:hypothetical protein
VTVQLWIALLIVLAMAGAIGGFVFRKVRRVCDARPFLRVVLIVGAVAVLGTVAWALPRLGDLEPPFSESPSGLFVIAGRLLIVFFALTAALATLAATFAPARSRR